MPVREQRARPDIQRDGEPLDDRRGRIAHAALDLADIGPVKADPEPEIFLRPALVLAERTYVFPNEPAHIHKA